MLFHYIFIYLHFITIKTLFYILYFFAVLLIFIGIFKILVLEHNTI